MNVTKALAGAMTASALVGTSLAAAATTTAATTASAPTALRDYRSVAITANGERIAAIESDAGAPGQRPHGRIVVRDAASGKVTAEYDPCAACS